ncbi:MAG: sulfotransferase family 2 domain-containing protein [Pseudomonadota bacterium]
MASVAWPRSGHHLLLRLLAHYFGPRFGYGEYPIASVDEGAADGAALPADNGGVLALSSHHDVRLGAPIPAATPIIVQWREPVAAIQSEFELAVRAGQADTAETFTTFAEKRAGAFRRFMAKWLEAPVENRLVIEYDELVADPRSILGDAVRLFGEPEPDPALLSDAISSVAHVSVRAGDVVVRDGFGVEADRRVRDFRHFDAVLVGRISEIALGKAVAPFRRNVTRTVGAAAHGPGRPSSEGQASVPSAPPAQPAAPAPAPSNHPRHNLRPHERLVFMHIPKCAGSSLKSMLAAYFKPNEVFTHVGDVLPTMPLKEVNKFRFYAGHFSKHGVDAVPGPKRIVTVLREPRERVLSLYHFWRSHRAEVVERQNLKGPRYARELNLVDFLKCDAIEVITSTNNHMTRLMLGPLRLHQSQGFRLEDREYCVETAIANLSRFNYVAFSDTLEDDVARMMPLLGLGEAQEYKTLNTFEKLTRNPAHFEKIERQEPNEEAWELLNSLCYLDMAFYNRARHLRHTLRCPYPS